MAEATDTTPSEHGQRPASTKSSVTETCRSHEEQQQAGDVEKALPQEKETAVSQDPDDKDPNVVDWDGPDDPARPLNWTTRKKYANVLTVAALTLMTPFASSSFAPAVPEAMQDFGSDNIVLASFVVSVYVLGYAFGPLIIAPMSELYGRLPVYHTSTVLFILFNIGCAKSTSLSMEIVFRFLTGFVGVTPLTIGSGTIADMFKQEERGKVLSIWTFPVLLGPTLGPLVGGYLAEAEGWRFDFWFLVILGGAFLVGSVLIQRETYPPTLLARKTKRLQKETGNMKLRSAQQTTRTPWQHFRLNIIRPTKMLCLSPIVFGLSLYMAICYGYLYLLFTTITEVFQSTYGFSRGAVGLSYIGIGVGQFIALLAYGPLSDRLLKHMASKNGGEMKPEYRLPPMLFTSPIMPIGLLIYGWSAQYSVFWIVPIIGTALVGMGMLLIFMPIITYLVDAFTLYAASAIAANSVLRSLGGALLPLAGRSMYDALGYGWGNSVLAFIGLAMIPAVYVLYIKGEWLRKHPKFQMNL